MSESQWQPPHDGTMCELHKRRPTSQLHVSISCFLQYSVPYNNKDNKNYSSSLASEKRTRVTLPGFRQGWYVLSDNLVVRGTIVWTGQAPSSRKVWILIVAKDGLGLTREMIGADANNTGNTYSAIPS